MYHYVFKLFSQKNRIDDQKNLLKKIYDFSKKYFDGKVHYHFPRIFFFDTLLDRPAFRTWFNSISSEIFQFKNSEFGYTLFESQKIKELEPISFDPVVEYETYELIRIFWMDLYGKNIFSFAELLHFDQVKNLGLKKIFDSLGIKKLTDKQVKMLFQYRHFNDKSLFKNYCYLLVGIRSQF